MSKKIAQKERRTINHLVEVRNSGGDSDSRNVHGYAAKFNQESELIWGEWVEVIEPGFFDDVMEDDVRALFNHDDNFILARNTAGTLTMAIDETGLHYEYETPDITYANDLLTSIRLGNITQSSFAFTVAKAEWEKIENEDNSVKWVRHLVKAKRLFDVSPVTYPAYSTTEVSTRSFEHFKNENSKPPIFEDVFDNDKAIAEMRKRHIRLLELRA